MDKSNILNASSNENVLKNISYNSSSSDLDDMDNAEKKSNNSSEDSSSNSENSSDNSNDSLELSKDVSDESNFDNSETDDKNKYVTTNLPNLIKNFLINTSKIISSKNKNKYKNLVKKFNDNLKKNSYDEYILNLDILFPVEKINKKEKKDVIQVLKKSLNIDENKSLEILEKKLNTLEEAKKFIDDYYINFSNESKKIKKSSINLAINGGFYLDQIKEMCKNKQKKLSNNERRKYKFQLVLKTCENVKWTYPYVQFLIKLYKLSKEFPILKLVTVNLEFLKNNFKAVKVGVKADSDFWKQENLS